MNWLSSIFSKKPGVGAGRNRETYSFSIIPLTETNKTPMTPIYVSSSIKGELEEIFDKLAQPTSQRGHTWSIHKFSTTLEIGDKDTEIYMLNWLLRVDDYVLTPIVNAPTPLLLDDVLYSYSIMLSSTVLGLSGHSRKNFAECQVEYANAGVSKPSSAIFLAVNLGHEQRYATTQREVPPYLKNLPRMLEELRIDDIFPKSIRAHKAIFDANKIIAPSQQYAAQIEDALSKTSLDKEKIELAVGKGTFILLTASREE